MPGAVPAATMPTAMMRSVTAAVTAIFALLPKKVAPGAVALVIRPQLGYCREASFTL